MDDQQTATGSDINWSSSERPVVSGLCAIIGVAVGYVGGLEGLLWWVGSPLTPWREIPGWIWHIVRFYGVVPPVVGGWIPAALAAGLGVGFGVGGWILATRDNVRHIRGLQIHTSARRAARTFRPFQGKLKGVPIHPAVNIGEHQECRHIFVLGGAGAGKTTILWPMLLAIIARGDKLLLLDFKGDFTKGLPRPFCLLSPADARSSRWLLGRDIRTRLDAMAFAETLIPLPAGGDLIWARGARGLLIALIAHLQTVNGANWGFSDLAQLAGQVLLDYKLLVSIVVREHPPAKGFLMGEDSRTTQSFLAELSGALGHAIEMGVADHTILKKKKVTAWSIRDWLDQNSKLPRVAVIGWDTDSTELSQAWSATLIEQMVRQIGRMPDVPPDKRRIWLFLDEVAQAGKIPSITNALVTLRSKGARTLIAMQSIAQPHQSYDQHTLTIWAGSCATKILCSLGSEADQKFGSGMLGEREVERYTTQVTQSPGTSGPSRSGSWQRVREPVLLPSELGYRLTPDANGVKSLILSAGKDVAALLRWPFYKVPDLRKDRIEAAWKAVDFKRPRWGEDPLPIADVPADDGERLDPMVNPNPDISNIQKKAKAGPDRDLETEKPKGAATKTPQMKAAIPTAQPSKPPKKTQPETDPFADIIGGALIDTIVPGGSIVADLINTVAPDSADTGIDLPIVPGTPPPEPGAADEIGAGHEPEAGD